jgi:hypothetical protein
MKTPTLEEVKQKYLNAKEIRNVYGKRIIKKELKPHYSEAKYFIFCWNNHIILWENGEYAEIISYKDEPIGKAEQLQTPKHYDNSKGSLYQFCENQNLNSYEFEIIKRVVRCRKKGEFISDIEKTIKVLQIYLQEQGEKYSGQIEKLNEYEK